MAYTPEHLKLWEGADPALGTKHNYMGASWRDYYMGPIVTRDSGPLEKSNYHCTLAELQEIPEPTDWPHDDGPVCEAGFHHWACGWFDQIMVHKDAEPHLRKLDEIAKALKDYPVLDHLDFSERENDMVCDYWSHASLMERRDILEHSRSDASVFCIRRSEFPDDPNRRIYEYIRRGER